MLSLDRWAEILDTLWRNKLRSALTAFSMAWGIFMLVVLLGLGNGMKAGVQAGFADDAVNSIWIFGGQTSRPTQGLPVGRRVVFDNADVDRLAALPGVEHITGRFHIRGGMFGGELPLRAGAKAQGFDVRAVHPGHLYLEKTIMVAGRYLNDRDVAQRRKVLVVGIPVARFLFGDPDAAIGRWVDVNRVPFQVVGVFDDEGGEGEQKKAYLPITTAQAAFNGADRVNMVMFTTDEPGVEASRRLAERARGLLAEAHRFAPDDPQAARVRNNVENYEQITRVFTMIAWFVSVMAACTIVAGVVGVSNIMMIVVRERTREIGVRKALGATPWAIVSAILQESVFLSALAGLLGMVFGVLTLTGIERVMPPNEMFGAPTVELGVAVWATGVLVVAGALAGLAPAIRAARINPIEALRDA